MTADGTPRPRTVDGAALTIGVAAVMNTVLAVTLLGRTGTARTDAAEVGPGVDPDAVAAALVGVAAVVLLYSGLLVLLAVLIRRGSNRARLALLVLAPLALLAIVAPTTPGITVVVLLGIAAVLLLRRDVVAWFRTAVRRPGP